MQVSRGLSSELRPELKLGLVRWLISGGSDVNWLPEI